MIDQPANQRNGSRSETVRFASAATIGSSRELSKKEIDWVLVASTKRVLVIATVLCLLLIFGGMTGAFISASLSLFVNVACLLAVFSRHLFLLDLLSVADTSTMHTSQYKMKKLQLLLSLCADLVASSVLGGSLYLAVHRLVEKDYYFIRTGAFLITSAVCLPFIAILCCLLGKAKKLDQKSTFHNTSSKLISKQRQATLVAGDARFSSERGLILRRSLNRMSIRYNHCLLLVLLLQWLVTFITALTAYFKPQTLMSDSVIALFFTPLAIIMVVSLLWDVISVMTEGILQGFDFAEVADSLINIDGVTGVRHLRIWSTKTEEVSLSVQIAIDEKANFDVVLRKANDLLKTKYDIYQYKIDTVDDDMD